MIDQLLEYSDLRIAEKEILTTPDLARNYYIHLLPVLPWWTNRVTKYKDEEINLFNYSCTCTEYQQRSELFLKPRDVRRICKHIYYKLDHQRFKEHIDPLSQLLIKSSAIHNELLHFKYEYLGNEYFFGFKPNTNWINVYLQQKDTFIRFSFNPVEYRWSYKSEPEAATYLILMIEKILEFQLPFTHNWIINKQIQR